MISFFQDSFPYFKVSSQANNDLHSFVICLGDGSAYNSSKSALSGRYKKFSLNVLSVDIMQIKYSLTTQISLVFTLSLTTI